MKTVSGQNSLRSYVKQSHPTLKMFECYIDVHKQLCYIGKRVTNNEIFLDSYNPIKNISKKPRKNMRPSLCIRASEYMSPDRLRLYAVNSTSDGGYYDCTEGLDVEYHELRSVDTIEDVTGGDFMSTMVGEDVEKDLKIFVIWFNEITSRSINTRRIKN